MHLEQLERLYWEKEAKLRAIASAHDVSVKELTENIACFEDLIREQVATILWAQVSLMERILPLKRSLISSAPVVNLSSYRAHLS